MMYGNGIILEEGVHYIDSPAFQFEGFVRRTKEHINVGRLHRVLVPAGKIGLAWDKGAPIVVEHGEVFETVSGFFSYKGSVDLTKDVIIHGSLKFIQVKEGTYGISNNEGVLQVLQPGRHVLTKPTHTFQGFLPSGQITLAIEAVTSMSADNVGIKFDSALTIQVSDARLACSQLGMYSPETLNRGNVGQTLQDNKFSLQAFYANVIAKAKLSLSILIGNNRINQSFKVTSKPARKVVMAEVVGESAPGNEDPEAEEDPAGSFKQHIHDIFMHSFSEDMQERCGVNVIDMSIEDIVITNQELARAMARGAVAATDLDKSRIEFEVNQTKAKSARAAMITKAQGEAEAMGIIAQAEADRIKKLDDAMKGVSDVTRQRELINSAVMYQVMKISRENREAVPDVQTMEEAVDNEVNVYGGTPNDAHFEKLRYQIVLDYGMNARYNKASLGVGTSNKARIYKFTPPTTAVTWVGQCSNRGLCDGGSGICQCFPGCSGDDCSTMNALAQ